MSVFNEFFYPRKTFLYDVPLICNNNTVAQGEISVFHRSIYLNYVSKLI